MKILKKVICIVIVALVSLMIYSTSVKAATTLKVTADTLNLRKKASTSSDILTLISNGETCELIEEDGDWYKVKYKTYTGYVSKDYVKKETSTSEKDSNEVVDENDSKTDDNSETSDNGSVTVTAKMAKKTSLKLVPLMYSSDIDTLNKNEEITIISELNGWAYIQTETATGWVRVDNIKGKQTISNSNTDDDSKNETTNQEETTNEEQDNKNEEQVSNNIDNTDTTTSESYEKKTMYINDYLVNVRKEPNTSSEVVMILALNTKLTVIGETGDWYKVSTSEGDAYVSKELLSSKQVTSTRGETKKIISNSSDNIADTITTSNTTKKETTTVSSTSNKTNTSTTTSSKKGRAIVAYAKKFLGVPYVYGGASKSGFDCSGFTMYVYKKYGISMSHSAQAQSKLGKAVKANKNSASSLKQNLQVGDLVFFLDYETMDEIGHCGIYIGNGEFIHASSGSGYCVKINSLLPGEYYNTRYCGARRLV